jgi:predicted DNA-binding transcriptional regulator AlpA
VRPLLYGFTASAQQLGKPRPVMNSAFRIISIGAASYCGPRGPEMARHAALPPTLQPRLICREAAAAYISVAPGTFDKMVEDGRMPRAKRLTEGRVAWDIRALDAAVDSLPSDGMSVEADDSWSDVDAI